ncbi:MAG: hypothetical protein HC881_16250 [Leptolyngbyaceae cyanobacterium SL_7_1]|nr:hypothetical protein [Leptolyngbyaceae cyanobacterium SL_7_1]
MLVPFFYENLLFVAIATLFFLIVGWAWKNAKPYTLPQPLPGWFRIWFLSIQIIGIGLPVVALGWCFWQGYSRAVAVLLSYLLLLGLQILSESLCLRQFRSIVFVMVPYVYLPYRVWQLVTGLAYVPEVELGWLRSILIGQIVLWIGNYLLDLSQLPRLLHWQIDPSHQQSRQQD